MYKEQKEGGMSIWREPAAPSRARNRKERSLKRKNFPAGRPIPPQGGRSSGATQKSGKIRPKILRHSPARLGKSFVRPENFARTRNHPAKARTEAYPSVTTILSIKHCSRNFTPHPGGKSGTSLPSPTHFQGLIDILPALKQRGFSGG